MLRCKNGNLHFWKNPKMNICKTVSRFTQQLQDSLFFETTKKFKDLIVSWAILTWKSHTKMVEVMDLKLSGSLK